MADREVRVAPHIYRSRNGWRVYVRRDGALKPIRFKADATLETLTTFVADYQKESARLKRERRAEALERAGTFAGDAAKYLHLKAVQAMPSFADRKRDIDRWVAIFGRRPRGGIASSEIDEQLQVWIDAGVSPSTVNKRRTALMSLYTRLDGRGSANPVRESHVFEEAAPEPRGLPYWLIVRLLNAVPVDRSRPEKGVKGSRDLGSLTRVWFEIMAWTGMTPMQIEQLRPDRFNLAERWYLSPPRRKGHRRPRHPRPLVKKPMTERAHAAFARLVKLKAVGRSLDRSSMRHSLERARKAVERQLRKQKRDDTYVLPRIRPYDFRHSFGTELYRQTKRLELVAEMLDHSTFQMTKRYALGAVSAVLKEGMQRFEAATGRRGKR